MIGQNQKKITNAKIRNKAGGNTNESCFGGDIREMRSHKVTVIPSVNTNSLIKLEQGWNNKSKVKDVVRVSIGAESTIVTREELEQALFALAQSDEGIKYVTRREK